MNANGTIACDHIKYELLGEFIQGSLSSRDAISYAVNMRCLKRPEAEELFR